MRYFHYIAEQAFMTAPDGRRLFYRGGPWSRPYLVPDPETEQRLFTKQLWMMRVLLGAMIIGQPFLFLFVHDVLTKPLWFLGYIAIVLAVFRVVGTVVFRNELSELTRAEARVSLHDFYSGMAARHSGGLVILMVLGSFAFVASGFWMLSGGQNVFFAWLTIGVFGMCGAAWIYAFFLKLTEG